MPLLVIAFLCVTLGFVVQSAATEPPQTPQTESALPADTKDPGFEQATRLLQQGKADEAVALLEGIAVTDPTRKGRRGNSGSRTTAKGNT